MDKLPNPFIADQPTLFEETFEAFAEQFFEEIEPMPAFLSDPSPEYLDALWLYPIVEILKAHH